MIWWIWLTAGALLLLSTAAGARIVEHPAYFCGFPDGSLRADAALTREQLAQVLCRLLPQAIPETPARVAFVDVSPRRWSYDAVCAAVAMGFWTDVETAQFMPEQPVTQAELYAALRHAASWEAAFSAAVWPQFPEAVVSRGEAAQSLNTLLGRTERQFPEQDAPEQDRVETAMREAATWHTSDGTAWYAVG